MNGVHRRMVNTMLKGQIALLLWTNSGIESEVKIQNAWEVFIHELLKTAETLHSLINRIEHSTFCSKQKHPLFIFRSTYKTPTFSFLLGISYVH